MILLAAGLWAPGLAAVDVAGATSSTWERVSAVVVVPVAWPLAAALVAPALRHRLARMLVLVAGTVASNLAALVVWFQLTYSLAGGVTVLPGAYAVWASQVLGVLVGAAACLSPGPSPGPHRTTSTG